MFPALKEGQDVLVWTWFFKLKAGDIVVIKIRGKEIIKRIKKIKGSQIFIEGDNKAESTDSRNFGPIKDSGIVGKVILVVR